MKKHEWVKEILIDEKTIQKRITELAAEVSAVYEHNQEPVILVGILRGCLPFFSDFMMALEIPCALDFMYVESYSGRTYAQAPKIKIDLISEIKNRDIIIVEDIIDSGNTLVKIVEHLRKKGPKSIKILTLLDKKVKRQADIEADWFGFEVPDNFLIGYGLDYQEILRNLPYIAIADISKLK